MQTEIKKAIISLDNIPDDALAELRGQFHLIDEQDPYVIWENWRYKRHDGRTNEYTLQSILALETFLFINYLKNHGVEDIEVFNNQELFLFNDDLYRIRRNSVEKEDIQGVGFFGVRPTNWHYPFFGILEQLITANGGVFNKTNRVAGQMPLFKGKFFAIHSLYHQRKRLLGDIIIPYKVKKHRLLFDFVHDHFAEKIILKKDNSQLGQGVFPINTTYDGAFDKFAAVMKTHLKLFQEVYILPFYDFTIEYRVYFTKFDGEIELYSMKTKQVSQQYGDVFTKDNFEYYKNVHLKWEYVEKDDWPEEVVSVSLDYIKAMEYTTGSLEFGRTVDGQWIFFEVNSMSDPVAYEGEDIKDMQRYYEKLFSTIVLGE